MCDIFHDGNEFSLVDGRMDLVLRRRETKTHQTINWWVPKRNASATTAAGTIWKYQPEQNGSVTVHVVLVDFLWIDLID